MAAQELYQELRPGAFGIAYRMLGSVSEAEDLVQEGLLRLHRALEDGEPLGSPKAYLSTIVTRLAIDHLRSARVRRETYVGEWLPEPLITSDEDDPSRHAEMADSLSLAFLVLLESLSPEQRAVFLLRDVFDYPYDRIAAIVGKSEAATRQIATRARLHLADRRPRYEPSRRRREELAERFFAAAGDGDLERLESLLAEDVELHGDGGGRVPALARALYGRRRVAHTLAGWIALGGRAGGIEFRRAKVNGHPGAVITGADGGLIGVWSLGIAEDRIQSIRSVVNPDKLAHLGPVSGLTAMLENARRDGG
ncbi:RNA polymerase sigma-70 factor [Candidatus Solirubrobacter pratensis]|uniref:RNA polymerase sigma-70 factor n=1 Tax=Candidatus Solirubrobacter pratensis TaxID=1298857 RepID=UPI00040F8DEB|nr:RNA polymerase sigma-70 factor [Candidatus Solirubrobacter pratensis]